jgi:sugar phosphate isomerase/epimerase
MFPLRLRGRKVGAFHAIRTLEDLEGFEHVVLDTSHAAVAGVDLLDALERLGSRLAHVHLSNNAGRGWDSHLPLDEGVLPIYAFLDALAARGYAGSISLEIDLRRHLDDPNALRGALAADRDRCAARLAPVG